MFCSISKHGCVYLTIVISSPYFTREVVQQNVLGRQQSGFCSFIQWGRVTHICIGNLTIIGSDNGLSPAHPQAIIWTNAGILIIGPLDTNFCEILIEILTFLFKKMHLKMLSAKWRSFCLDFNVLRFWNPEAGFCTPAWGDWHTLHQGAWSCRKVRHRRHHDQRHSSPAQRCEQYRFQSLYGQ